MPHSPSSENLTVLLKEAAEGNSEARGALWELIYPDLKTLAHRELQRKRPRQTLQTTELVHEAYIRLIDQEHVDWQSRLHFYSVAGKAMRHVLVDYVRQRHRKKRGGIQRPLQLDEALMVADDRTEVFLALDRSLSRLSTLSERLGNVVECRFFAGMNEEEIANLHDVAVRTVRRDWRKAKAWLAADLAES